MTRGERIQRTQNIVRQREQAAARIGTARPRGTYKDRHPLDCGKTQCFVCHLVDPRFRHTKQLGH